MVPQFVNKNRLGIEPQKHVEHSTIRKSYKRETITIPLEELNEVECKNKNSTNYKTTLNKYQRQSDSCVFVDFINF